MYLTAEVLTTTQVYLVTEERVTQELVANSFIESYNYKYDYSLAKDSANDLFRSKRLYKGKIVGYYRQAMHRAELIGDVEELILNNIFLQEEYLSKLYEIIKKRTDIPKEYCQKIWTLINDKKYEEAVAEIFVVAISYDYTMKKLGKSV